MVICFALRYFASTTAPMPYDEAMLVKATEEISLRPGAVNLPLHGYNHPLAQLYFAKLGTLLLGHNLVGFRFMSVVLGAAGCWLIFALVRRAWGVWPAVFSLALLCFNGFHIGVSRFALERTYLFFVALALYLFWRAVHEERPGLFLAAGAAIGVGALTSEHSLFLLPIFAIYLALDGEKRKWYGRWQTYAAVVLAFAIFTPEIYWMLTNPGEPGFGQGATQLDTGDQMTRLRPGHLSAAPLALYIPPLYYKFSERLSVYPVMSLAGGLMLLAGVLHATATRQNSLSKLLLVLFWLIFAGFTFTAGPLGEFKWVAMTLFAAAPLAGRMLYRLFERQALYGVLGCISLLYIAAFGIWVANHSINCYYSPLWPPSDAQVSTCRAKQDLYVIVREECDFPSLMGSPLFPARYRSYYVNRYLLAISLLYNDDLPDEDPAEKLPRMLDAVLRIAPDDPEVRAWQRRVEDRHGGVQTTWP